LKPIKYGVMASTRKKNNVPTLREISKRADNSLKLPEDLNPEDYEDSDESELNGSDITCPMPDWMKNLLDENDTE